MYWADRLVEKLDRNKKHRVDDMKTPSGHAHVGSLRAIGTHALVFEAMKHAGLDGDFTYVVNDMDPMDGMPVYLDEKEYGTHMGKPLFLIPAPDGTSESMAHQYAHEYIAAFQKLGFLPEIFWSSQLYTSGKMNDYIRTVLDNVETIRTIYKEVAEQHKPKGWYPLQVICPNCQKVGSSLVTDWDGTEVTYTCTPDLVTWAVGCGHSGKISPFDGNAKLMWKIDWPAHWAVLGITVEGAGKDHMTAGGSHEIAERVSREVFKKDPPFAFLHEFFSIGGAKMSSSKGNAMTAADLVTIIPVELARFLLVRTPYQRTFNFNPAIPETILDLFDEYDRCGKMWYSDGDNTQFGRMYQASQVNKTILDEPVVLPRFRKIAQMVQFPSVDVRIEAEKEKGSTLSDQEKKLLDERVQYAHKWLETYATAEYLFTVKKELPEVARELTEEQKIFISQVGDMLASKTFTDGEELQADLFEIVKASALESKEAFQTLYKIFLGKTEGPKVGWILYDLMKKDRQLLDTRIEEVTK